VPMHFLLLGLEPREARSVRRPRLTFPVSTGTKLYCFVTEAHVCQQLAEGRYVAVGRRRVEPTRHKSNVLTIAVFAPSSHTTAHDLSTKLQQSERELPVPQPHSGLSTISTYLHT